MKTFMASIFQLLFVTISFSQNQEAFDLLLKAQENHVLPSSRFQLNAVGKHYNDSHLKDPNQLNQYEFDLKVQADPLSNSYLFLNTFTDTNNKKRESQLLIQADQEYQFSQRSGGYLKTHEDNNISNIIESIYLDPGLLLDYLIRNKEEIRFSIDENNKNKIVCVLPNGDKWLLQLDKRLRGISFSNSYFHYLYGDIIHQVSWSGYKKTGNRWTPSRIVVNNKGFNMLELSMSISDSKELATFKLDSIVGDASKSVEKDRIINQDSISINKIDQGIFEILLPETNNRLMVIEFRDFLVLLEGSYHSKNGDLVLDFITEKFPGKPVKYWSFSHCHTQYMGFARSLAANNTTIITTEDNQKFIQKLCQSSFTQRPDRQELVKAKPGFEVIESDWKFKDDQNEIEIYNVQSDHTINYIIFYFPKQKICFVGDLLWVSDPEKPITGRSVTFYNEVINRLQLDIEEFYTSWPLKYYGYKNKVSIQEIKL